MTKYLLQYDSNNFAKPRCLLEYNERGNFWQQIKGSSYRAVATRGIDLSLIIKVIKTDWTARGYVDTVII